MYYIYDCSYGLDWIGSEFKKIWIGLDCVGRIKKIGPMSNSDHTSRTRCNVSVVRYASKRT